MSFQHDVDIDAAIRLLVDDPAAVSKQQLAAVQADHEMRSGVDNGGREPLSEYIAQWGIVAPTAADPRLRLELIEWAKHSAHEVIRISALFNPTLGTAPDVSSLGDDTTRAQIAGLAPPVALEAFAADPHPGVRVAVARHHGATAEVLERLADDPETSVRDAVAGHHRTPPAVLERLSIDASVERKRAISRNALAPPNVLIQLASDSDSEVKKNLAINGRTPDAAFVVMSQDPDVEVRMTVARNSSASAEALERLSADEDKQVRFAVARNDGASLELLDRLSLDPEDHLRFLVAENFATPRAILERLSQDSDPSVRNAATGGHIGYWRQRFYSLLQPLAQSDDFLDDVRDSIGHDYQLDLPSDGLLAVVLDEDRPDIHRTCAFALLLDRGVDMDAEFDDPALTHLWHVPWDFSIAPELRAAIVSEHGGSFEDSGDIRYLVENRRYPMRPHPNLEDELASRVTGEIAEALRRAGESVLTIKEAGESIGQGSGCYDVIAIASTPEQPLIVSRLARVVKSGDERFRPLVTELGFHWLDDDLGSQIVPGLPTYFFGARDPLSVENLLFYWQD